MASEDWYRNEHWSSQIAEDFESRLARARASNRPQYLYLQAFHLAESAPSESLALIHRYFATDDAFHVSSAIATEATARLALGDEDGAIQAWERALEHEKTHPHLVSTANCDYVRFIAANQRADLYGRAAEVISANEDGFVVDGFLRCAISALNDQANGRPALAKMNAKHALRLAAVKRSGFRYHPGIGLVDHRHLPIVRHMHRIAHPVVIGPVRALMTR